MALEKQHRQIIRRFNTQLSTDRAVHSSQFIHFAIALLNHIYLAGFRLVASTKWQAKKQICGIKAEAVMNQARQIHEEAVQHRGLELGVYEILTGDWESHGPLQDALSLAATVLLGVIHTEDRYR